MASKRGKRWTASGYDKALKRKVRLGSFDTKKEALQAEADHRLRTRATGRETCDEFANRWTRDYPRPRASTNGHNAERVKRFAKDFAGVKLVDVDRPTARTGLNASGKPSRGPCDVRRRDARRADRREPICRSASARYSRAQEHHRVDRQRAARACRPGARSKDGAWRVWPGVPCDGAVLGLRRFASGRAVRHTSR